MARKSKQLPPQSYLKQIFQYCPKTGQLFWRVSRQRAALNQPIKSKTNEGYCRVGIDGTRYYLHRIIWKLVHNTEPKQIDHINGNRSDNRIENLRSVLHADNGKNQKRHVTNSSGVTGVYWSKRDQVWRANITANRNKIHLGTFKTKSAAIEARKKAEAVYGFHKNHGT